MKKIDMLVQARHMYTMEGSGLGYKANGVLAIDGGKIIDVLDNDVARSTYTAEQDIVLDHHVVMPGFIDAHMHTGDNIMRGLAQDTAHWMMYGLQPFDNVVQDDELDAGSRLAIIEAIKAGTTTLTDYNWQMDNVCEFIKKTGARGHITQMIRAIVSRVYKPGELYEFDEKKGEESFRRNLELYKKWNGFDGGRIKILFGPQGVDFVSPELLMRVKRAVDEYGSMLHMHVQQGDRETYQVEKRYGKRPTAFLKEMGILDKRLMAVHLTDCNREEVEVIAKSGASMVFCPASIAIIDGMLPPAMEFLEAGGTVALGSDQAPGNNCHNMFNEMKCAALFCKLSRKNPEVMPAWKLLRMATIEGAKAIGLGDEIGSLEVGKRADLIAVDVNVPSMQPVYSYPMRNLVPNLVYSARGCEVAMSIVEGRVIMQDGKINGIDEMEYINDIQKYPEDIGKRAADEFFRINGTNAQFMSEGKL